MTGVQAKLLGDEDLNDNLDDIEDDYDENNKRPAAMEYKKRALVKLLIHYLLQMLNWIKSKIQRGQQAIEDKEKELKDQKAKEAKEKEELKDKQAIEVKESENV